MPTGKPSPHTPHFFYFHNSLTLPVCNFQAHSLGMSECMSGWIFLKSHVRETLRDVLCCSVPGTWRTSAVCVFLGALNKHCGVILTLSHMTAVRHTLITSAEIITLIYFACAYSIKPFECTQSVISIEVTARAKANISSAWLFNPRQCLLKYGLDTEWDRSLRTQQN